MCGVVCSSSSGVSSCPLVAGGQAFGLVLAFVACSLPPIVAYFQTIMAKSGKNEFLFGALGVFSGFSDTERGKI